MFHTLACLSSLLLTAPSGAQPPFDAGPRTKLIAPLLNEQTYAVVRVDLARLDEEGIVKAIVPLIPENLRDDFQDALQVYRRLRHRGNDEAVLRLRPSLRQDGH